jgi:hypothetical protein
LLADPAILWQRRRELKREIQVFEELGTDEILLEFGE